MQFGTIFAEVTRPLVNAAELLSNIGRDMNAYEVKAMKKNDELHFFLVPQREELPHMVLSMKVHEKVAQLMELQVLEKNPFNEKEKSIFNERDRIQMAAKPSKKLAAVTRRATHFINLLYHYPDHVILRIHNAEGRLKVGCNGFYTDANPSFPDHSLFTQIASKISAYIFSERGQKLKIPPEIGSLILEAAEIVSIHSHARDYGIIDPEIEYGWQEEAPNRPSIKAKMPASKKMVKKRRH